MMALNFILDGFKAKITRKFHLGPHSQNMELKGTIAGSQWLTPVILATQEAEIRRLVV
jgi:hypothetical protein